MCRFVETIRIEKEEIYALDYHNRRLNHTRQAAFGKDDGIDLSLFIQPAGRTQRTRCRVEYGKEVLKVEYQPYQMKEVESLKVVTDNHIQYKYKRTDRTDLNNLLAQRAGCDDILIVKNGLITDTSICNVAFFDGQEWFTPENPLLEGTARARLLDSGFIKHANITIDNILSYTHIRLFNAMIKFGELELEVQQIYV